MRLKFFLSSPLLKKVSLRKRNPMPNRYKILNPSGMFYVTIATVGWVYATQYIRRI